VSNSPVCVDASLVVQLVVGGTQADKISDLWQTWLDESRPLVAPTLLYCEVSNAIYRYFVHEYLLPEAADEALMAALSLDISLYEDQELHHRSLELARRFSLPATYDAQYLALSERLGAEFWTVDRRLAQVASAALTWVHLIE
jgi:predicted nucleic acid-binding protein